MLPPVTCVDIDCVCGLSKSERDSPNKRERIVVDTLTSPFPLPTTASVILAPELPRNSDVRTQCSGGRARVSEGSAVHVAGVHFWVGELVVEGAPGSRLGWEGGVSSGWEREREHEHARHAKEWEKR